MLQVAAISLMRRSDAAAGSADLRSCSKALLWLATSFWPVSPDHSRWPVAGLDRPSGRAVDLDFGVRVW